MSVNLDDIFASVKDSIAKPSSTSGLYREKIKFEQGKDYLVRLVPYVKEGKEGLHKTIYHYVKYSWKDDNGNWNGVLSPRTFGEKCPISDYSAKINKNGSDAEKEHLKSTLFYKGGYYVNAYVINDPTTPANNGKVKIIDMGAKLYGVIKAALEGELDDAWTEQYNNAVDEEHQVERIDVGKKVFDMSKDGVNLLIKVRKNQYGLNDYSSSEFTLKGAKLTTVDEATGKNVLISDEEREAIKQATHDLSCVERVLSFDEVSNIFKKSYLGIDVSKEEKKTVVSADTGIAPSKMTPVDDDDDGEVEAPAPSKEITVDTDEEIDNFLADFDV